MVNGWRAAHGFAPLLAESFSDPESCGFSHAAQVIEEERRYLHKETGEILTAARTGQPKIFIRHFITSLRRGEADEKKLLNSKIRNL